MMNLVVSVPSTFSSFMFFSFDLLPPSFFHFFLIVRLLESTSLFDKGIGIALVFRLARAGGGIPCIPCCVNAIN